MAGQNAGVYNATPPTLADTQRTDLQLDASGNLKVTGGVASGSADSGNPQKIGGVFNTTPPTLTNGQRGDAQMTSRAELLASISNGGIAASVGQLGTFGNGNAAGVRTNNHLLLFNGTNFDIAAKGISTARLLSSAATTNATSVKASAGALFKVVANNTVASKRYLKFYNKASAPTVGTDTPVLTFVLLASAAFSVDFGPYGQHFSTGIAYAITGAAADADTTAIASGDIECLNLTYA